MTTPPSSEPTPPPPTKDWSRSLLSWYYSRAGTVIRILFYVAIILLVVLWTHGYFRPSHTALTRLDVVSWKEKRWTDHPAPDLSVAELPFVEVTLKSPPGLGQQFSLDQLANGLALYSPDGKFTPLSQSLDLFLPTTPAKPGTPGKPGTAAPPTDPDKAARAALADLQPRRFGDNIILAFPVTPDKTATFPKEIWLAYLPPDADSPPADHPAGTRLIPNHLATLTQSTFQGATPPQP